MFTLAFTGIEWFYLAIALGSLVASVALQKKNKTKNPFSEQTTPLTERGAYLPNLWGRRRISPLIAWIGDRLIVKGRSGGGKGGSKGQRTFTYFEGSVHMLCVGTADTLHTIYADGKPIFPDKTNVAALERGSVPSGSTITLDNGDSFDIYWGEVDQPVNDYLGEDEYEDILEYVPGGPRRAAYYKKVGEQLTGDRLRMKVKSRWPNICYVMWRRKVLGGAPQWPNLNYEISRNNVNPQTALSRTSTYIPESGSGDNDGINPAHIQWELLNGLYPHGAAVPTDEIDQESFEVAAELWQPPNLSFPAAENLAFNSVAVSGEDSAQLLTQLLLDSNSMLSLSNGKLTLRPIRRPASGTVAVYDEDILVGTDPEITVFSSADVVDWTVFTFPDRTNKYKEGDRAIADDSHSTSKTIRRQKTVKIPNVVDQDNAEKVVALRMLQELANPALFQMSVTREARALLPGDLINTATLGVMRVATKQIDVSSPIVEIQAIRESFDVQAASFLSAQKPADDTTPTPEPDISSFVLELPYDVSPISAIGVVRQEAFPRIEGAVIHVSPDDVSYYSIGTETNTAATVTLTEEITEDDFEVVEGDSASFIIALDDTQALLDLTSDEQSWEIGRQWLLLNEEIMFVKAITSLGNGQYRISGLIRARYDTVRQEHLEGTVGFLFDQQQMTILRDPIVVSEGLNLFIKTQPFTAFEIDDLADQTAFEIPITVRSERPFPADNFVCNDDPQNPNMYPASTASQIFEWNYRLKQGRGSTAGELPAGTAVTVEDPPTESDYELNFFTLDDVLVGTHLVEADTSFTYTNALRNTDFGSRPSGMKVSITAIEGSRRSVSTTITVTEG